MSTNRAWLAVVAALLVLGSAVPAAGEPSKRNKNGGDVDRDALHGAWPTRKRAYLGVRLLRLTRELRAHFGAPDRAGLLVARVEEGGPAARAGVKVGDLLLAVDGQQVGSVAQVVARVRGHGRGDRIALRVIRGGKPVKLQATLDVRETPQVEVGTFFRTFRWPDGAEPGRVEGFDPGCLERTLQRMRKQMKQQMQSIEPGRRIFRYLERERELERRLQQMERKLHRLERKLQTRRGKARPTAA